MNSKSFKDILKDLYMYDFFLYLYSQFFAKPFFSDKDIIKRRFKKRLGREVELENPIRYNDKLQWLKMNWNDSLAVRCADKHGVRDYIKEKIGKKYLNEVYGVYDSINEINIDKLPNSFVLKGTHGSGWVVICNDKKDIKWPLEINLRMRWWLKTNYFWSGREWVYKDITPRIICEKYLEGNDGNPPRDYKVFCFNGKAKVIEVDIDRFGNHKRNFYDLDWNFLDVEIEYPNDSDIKVPPPENLKKMIELSEILSKRFPHVRVDWYEVQGKLIFGEFTFFHESGFGYFKPEKFEIEMGNWLDLSNVGKT